MDDLESLELDERMLKLKKRQLELDFEELELRKRRAILRVGGGPQAFIAPRQPSEEPSAGETAITTILALNQKFPELETNRLSSHGEESPKATDFVNPIARAATNKAAGKRPEKDAAQYDTLNPNVQTDQPQQPSHLYQPSSSTPVIAETPSDAATMIDMRPQASNVSALTSTDFNTSLTSRAAGSMGQLTEAKSKAYRKGKLFKSYTYLEKYYAAWTYQDLLDDLLKCRASHPEDWTPLEFLKRASFVSILRQAGLCDTKRAVVRKIASRDLNFANEHPAIYTERGYWSRFPEFQQVLDEQKLVEKEGLYWQLEEMPDNYDELMKTSGVPGRADSLRRLRNELPTTSMSYNRSTPSGPPSVNFDLNGAQVSSSGMARPFGALHQTQSKDLSEQPTDQSKRAPFEPRGDLRTVFTSHGNGSQNTNYLPADSNERALPMLRKRPRRSLVESEDSDYEEQDGTNE
ncbi:hypothetical protein LTR84_002605 [Exophiala bonariae]|uniref:Uncharacterized protein n=1 Tax=Exophiala bonariae TaxID=1690606 RepID=A0AAV9NDX5_9EURO|nr:hypothetical protein LTR84_002605 [Exophiala bonariae]